MTDMRHTVLMKHYLDEQAMRVWVKSVGGPVPAAEKIRSALGCSRSKAEKIAGCRYPSIPQPLERAAIAALIGKPQDLIYPLKGKSKRAS